MTYACITWSPACLCVRCRRVPGESLAPGAAPRSEVDAQSAREAGPARESESRPREEQAAPRGPVGAGPLPPCAGGALGRAPRAGRGLPGGGPNERGAAPEHAQEAETGVCVCVCVCVCVYVLGGDVTDTFRPVMVKAVIEIELSSSPSCFLHVYLATFAYLPCWNTPFTQHCVYVYYYIPGTCMANCATVATITIMYVCVCVCQVWSSDQQAC